MFPHTKLRHPAVCPGVARTSRNKLPKSIRSPCATVTSAAAPLLAAMTERTSGSAALMRPLPVTWSAWQWVLTQNLRCTPSSRISAKSRSTCSRTGSMSTASPPGPSAMRYVYVDDPAVSNSWRKIRGERGLSAAVTAAHRSGRDTNLSGGSMAAAASMAEAAPSFNARALWRMYGSPARVAVEHWIMRGLGTASTCARSASTVAGSASAAAVSSGTTSNGTEAASTASRGQLACVAALM
mmetsp:Transcript_24523/g.61104  ORF Transcript_24523/g.61104 Transcript_24523/m.61104 type:complete len:240 (-) Transcript_24523:199-918(-)